MLTPPIPSCALIHLPEPHTCPIIEECSHSDYEEIKKQNQEYAQRLEKKEQQTIQELNEALDSSEKDLKVIINRIKKLVHKPPVIIEDETTKNQLEEAQRTIAKLKE